MKTTLLTLGLMIGFQTLAQAEVKSYFMENQKFSVNVPANWKEATNFLGSPLAFFGPEQKDAPRVVMLFNPTGAEDKKGFFKHPPKDISTYKVGREEWLADNLGESISYDKFKQEKWQGIESSSQLGYHYDLASGQFYERSVYVTCAGNKIFYIKTLVPTALEKDSNSIVEQTIKSLKCEKTDVKTAQK